jgi:hypothetical protein
MVFPPAQRRALFGRGWVNMRNGDIADGVFLLRSGSIAYRAPGAELRLPYRIALLAAAFGVAEQVDEAMPLLVDAPQIVERNGERRLAAELNAGIKASCCCGRGITEPLRNCTVGRRASPRSRRLSSGNCDLPLASPGSAATRVVTLKPAPPRSSLRLVHRRLRRIRSQRRGALFKAFDACPTMLLPLTTSSEAKVRLWHTPAVQHSRRNFRCWRLNGRLCTGANRIRTVSPAEMKQWFSAASGDSEMCAGPMASRASTTLSGCCPQCSFDFRH